MDEGGSDSDDQAGRGVSGGKVVVESSRTAAEVCACGACGDMAVCVSAMVVM